MREKGYEREEYWSKEGWKWACGTKSKYPKFWVDRSQGSSSIEQPSNFTLRLMLNETETMPWDIPAEVNNFEASAYCRWLS